ncbi:MAG: hypothetical protein U0103_25200 [Candidatus Obscuribacterales bacterium]|nr:MAG: hypothetical protein EKK48_29030 [Candidatus Melainabacteria bacterium]
MKNRQDNQGAGIRRRNARGVLFATADLMMLIPVSILIVVCLVDAGLGCVYKQKMSFVMNQTANYIVNLPENNADQKQAESMLKQLCALSGLKGRNLRVCTKMVQVDDNDAVSLTAQIELPLLEGTALPVSLTMQDTVTAVLPANRVCAAIAISPYPYSTEESNTGPALYIPIIKPKYTMPIWQFPYDAAINNLHVKQGAAPALTPPPPQNPWFNDFPSLY